MKKVTAGTIKVENLEAAIAESVERIVRLKDTPKEHKLPPKILTVGGEVIRGKTLAKNIANNILKSGK
jgi:hypothetical protein